MTPCDEGEQNIIKTKYNPGILKSTRTSDFGCVRYLLASLFAAIISSIKLSVHVHIYACFLFIFVLSGNKHR